MNTKELQAWLFDRGFFEKGVTREKAVDGKMGPMTRAAVKKAQQKLAGLGLYTLAIDGIAGQGTSNAITAWNKGWSTMKDSKGRRFKYNRYEQDHVRQLRDWALKNGISKINIAGHTFNLGNADALSGMYQASLASLQGSKYVPDRTNVGDFNNQIIDGTKNPFSVVMPKGNWKTSFSNTDLDNLVMRYTFDKFHRVKTNDDEWGIKYNYTPRNPGTGAFRIGLVIGNRYTSDQAERIARGAGMKTYTYNGQTHNVNLFKGGPYKDEAELNAKITALEQAGKAKEAQKLYNTELARQYNTYGIDYNMLSDKNGFQWNLLYGVVPHGYNAASMGAISLGMQAYQGLDDTAPASGVSTSVYGYRYNGKNQGRFVYDNFDQWYQGRILGNSKYQHGPGLSARRAVTSTYYWGIPVAQSVRSQLKFTGARENSNTQIDRTNYYDITDKDRGASRMQPWVYNKVVKNPKAAYDYMHFIYGDRRPIIKEGVRILESTNGRNYKFDKAQATKLAEKAGLIPYHMATGNAPWQEEKILGRLGGSHDIYECLKSFYENAYDEKGNLKPDFQYTENGYDNQYDGGAYTVVIRNGKPKHAEDAWNIDLDGHDLWMNAGINGKGIPSITRYNKLGGRLLMMCQAGGGLKGGKKRGDTVNTDQCARWSNSLLRKNGYNISGSAWALNDVDFVFNGYDGLKKPEGSSDKAIDQYNRAASKNVLKNFDSKTLNQDKPYVVNMYYKDSPQQQNAYANGRDVTGTHTGILTFEDGRWVVTHNIHGKIHQDDFIGLQGGRGNWGVTAIYSPNKASSWEKMKSDIAGLLGFKYGGVLYKHP